MGRAITSSYFGYHYAYGPNLGLSIGAILHPLQAGYKRTRIELEKKA